MTAVGRCRGVRMGGEKVERQRGYRELGGTERRWLLLSGWSSSRHMETRKHGGEAQGGGAAGTSSVTGVAQACLLPVTNSDRGRPRSAGV